MNDDRERILQCRERIIRAINEAHIPLAVSALILENVQLQVQLEAARSSAGRAAAQKEENTDGKPNEA